MAYCLIRYLHKACRVDYMATFTAYFDASGDQRQRTMSVAGFVSRANKWERYEAEWKKLLPRSVTMFHMTDFVSGRNGWESWAGPHNSHRRIAIIESLVGCIKKSTNKGFSITLRTGEWKECNQIYKLKEHYGGKRLVNRLAAPDPSHVPPWDQAWAGTLDRFPVMREQFSEPIHGMRGDPRSTSRNQANGSTPQRLQVAMKLINTAAVLPPLSLPKNVQLPRPMATSRLARSVAPLSISRSPSSRNRHNASH